MYKIKKIVKMNFTMEDNFVETFYKNFVDVIGLILTVDYLTLDYNINIYQF